MWRVLCHDSRLACVFISTFVEFSSPTSLHFPPLLQSQGIRLCYMFDPEVLLAPFLVAWVECGIATTQKSQFAGVRSDWNSFPCTRWMGEERGQDVSVGAGLPCLPFLIHLCLPIACWGRAGSCDLDQAGVADSRHGWPALVLTSAGSGESCMAGSLLSLGGHITAWYWIKCLWLKVLGGA